MEWTDRMREEEALLRGLVDKLGKTAIPGVSHVERGRLMTELGESLDRTREYIRDCLTGRSEHEQCLMQYRIRVEFPLYSHLDSIFTISAGAYADVDCA